MARHNDPHEKKEFTEEELEKLHKEIEEAGDRNDRRYAEEGRKDWDWV